MLGLVARTGRIHNQSFTQADDSIIGKAASSIDKDEPATYSLNVEPALRS